MIWEKRCKKSLSGSDNSTPSVIWDLQFFISDQNLSSQSLLIPGYPLTEQSAKNGVKIPTKSDRKMSFLAGRSAGREAAYFFEESKHLITRLVDKTPLPKTPTPPTTSTLSDSTSADVLPEVLRHSLPPKLFHQPSNSSSSSLSSASKWAIRPSNSQFSSQYVSLNHDAINPLRGYLSLPQVTFGPKRWQLPTAQSSVIASTANELRRDQQAHGNPEKLRAAAEGLAQIGKAFAVATAIIFGGAALTFGLAASKLDFHNTDDIRTKGKNIVQPKFESIKDQLSPLRHWAEGTSKKWHLKSEKDIKERPIIRELSKTLGTKTSTRV